jgi:hypothetical protein
VAFSQGIRSPFNQTLPFSFIILPSLSWFDCGELRRKTTKLSFKHQAMEEGISC